MSSDEPRVDAGAAPPAETKVTEVADKIAMLAQEISTMSPGTADQAIELATAARALHAVAETFTAADPERIAPELDRIEELLAKIA